MSETRAKASDKVAMKWSHWGIILGVIVALQTLGWVMPWNVGTTQAQAVATTTSLQQQLDDIKARLGRIEQLLMEKR